MSVIPANALKVGDTIPPTDVKEKSATEKAPLNLSGTVVILGVPGAFTGTCHAQVPGFLESWKDFKSKGADRLYVVAVNDYFVMNAWKENLVENLEGNHDLEDVHFIADDTGSFTQSLNLIFDASGLVGNPRSLRYCLVAKGGKVVSLAIEPNPSKLTITAAKEILANLAKL